LSFGSFYLHFVCLLYFFSLIYSLIFWFFSIYLELLFTLCFLFYLFFTLIKSGRYNILIIRVFLYVLSPFLPSVSLYLFGLSFPLCTFFCMSVFLCLSFLFSITFLFFSICSIWCVVHFPVCLSFNLFTFCLSVFILSVCIVLSVFSPSYLLVVCLSVLPSTQFLSVCLSLSLWSDARLVFLFVCLSTEAQPSY
jgi:hypothetical protein